MSKEISLTQGKVAIVDDADYKRLSRWKWYAAKHHNIWYAVRHSPSKNSKRKTIHMHRLILCLKSGDPRESDHRNHDGLNNQRRNLRIATRAQNIRNQRPQKRTSSRFKGVCWDRHAAKWLARIRVEGRLINLGHFVSEIDAAKTYDAAACKYFSEFARMNFGANDDC